MKATSYFIMLLGFFLLTAFPEVALSDMDGGGMMGGGMMYQGGMGAHHYVLFGLWVIVKAVVIAISLWLLYRIAKALEAIARSKEK